MRRPSGAPRQHRPDAGQRLALARLRELIDRQLVLGDELGALNTALAEELATLGAPAPETGDPASLPLAQISGLLARLAVAPTESDAIEVMVAAARELMPGTRGAFGLGTEDAEPAVVGVWDGDAHWNRGYGRRSTASPPQQLMQREAPGPRGAALEFPIRGFGLRLGTLRVWPESDAALLGDTLEPRAELLARCAGLVLGGMALQRRLRHYTLRDPLTGLYNPHCLREHLQRELDRAARRKAEVALMLVDVDRFGLYNDRFGHEQGDRMLQAIAALLRERFRRSDVACRLSGERFALIMPETAMADGRARAESLRQSVGDLTSGEARISVSVGVAAYPADGDHPDALVAAADTAIQRARQAGGDQVGDGSP